MRFNAPRASGSVWHCGGGGGTSVKPWEAQQSAGQLCMIRALPDASGKPMFVKQGDASFSQHNVQKCEAWQGVQGMSRCCKVSEAMKGWNECLAPHPAHICLKSELK